MQIKNEPGITGNRQPVNPGSSWLNYLAFAVPFLAAGIVYFLTSAAGLTWRLGGDDGGDLATAVALDGVPHPTGYPLYLLTGKLLSFLATDPARALTLATAFWGALAAGVLSLAVFCLTRRLLGSHSTLLPLSRRLEIAYLAGGWLAGLLLAFAPLVWSQAVIIEIYSLNLLLLAGLLLTMVWWQERPESQARWFTLAAVAGLGAGHHRTAVFSLLAVALFLFFTASKRAGVGANTREESRRLFTWKRILAGVVLLGLAAGLPSLLLLARGGQNPASNWDNLGWSDPAGFFQYLTGGEYRNLLFAAPVSQDIGRIGATAGLLFQQFGLVGLALGWVGLAILWLGQSEYRPLAWLVTTGLAGHLFFAAVYAADNSQVYLLPFFLFWAVAAGFGLAWLILTAIIRWPGYQPLLIGGALLAAVVVPGTGLAVNYSRLDLSGDHSAEAWAKTQLDAAPNRSIVLTHQDSATFALWYVQYVQHYRPEISVIETRLLGTNWYRRNLARLYPDLKLPEAGDSTSLSRENPDHKVVQLVAPDQNSLP